MTRISSICLLAINIKTAVKNKVPHVRSLTLNWLTFCIESSNKAIVLKLHKEYVPICMEFLNDGTPDVRDAAFSALVALAKLVGMRPLENSLEKLDEVRKKKLSEMIGSSGGGPPAAAGSATVKSSSGSMSCSEFKVMDVRVETGAGAIFPEYDDTSMGHVGPPISCSLSRKFHL